MMRKNIILKLIITLFVLSCSKDNEAKKTVLEISAEIEALVYYSGEEDASTVLINTQGGPITELDTEGFDDLLSLVNTPNLLNVNVHQAQTLNPSDFSSDDITFEQAINYDAESIEVLYKVIKYFKDQGRTVYVLGISFGAFMTQELIVRKGLDVADKYLIMVGRLDIDEVFWQGFSEGKIGFFENGILPSVLEQDDVTLRNMSRLAAGLGRNRYTQLLNEHEDLSKVIYVYGKTDENVGKLTEAELQFLQSKNANIISGNGGHGGTIDSHIAQGFEEAFGIE